MIGTIKIPAIEYPMCEALCQVLSIQYLSQSFQVFKLNTFITSMTQLKKLKHCKLDFLVSDIVRI